MGEYEISPLVYKKIHREKECICINDMSDMGLKYTYQGFQIVEK